MGTTPTIKLIRGARKLDLTSGRYRVSRDFSPPPVQQVTTVASGTSANRTGNVIAVDRRAKTRTWSWSIDVYGDTEAEVRRGLSDLSAFLAWAGDDADPVYLSYKPNSDTPEPVWGQDGTLRYEIIEGNVDIGNSYGVQRLREKYVSTNPVSLSIQPYAVGLPQTAAQAKGGVVHDTPGTTDGRDRGVSVPFATTNYITNPVFGNATWNSGWTAGANLTASENSDMRYVLFGVRSAKLQATGATRLFYQALTLTVATYTISFYAKRPDGDTVDANTCQAYFNNTLQTSTYTSVGDGWWRVTYSGTASAAAANYGVGLASGQVVYVDGFQVEAIGFATPLHFGDMYGYAWSGTAHASTTTATTGYLRVPMTTDNLHVGQGSIRAVVNVPTLGFGSNPVVFYEAATLLRLYYDTATTKWIFTDNVNSITGGTALTAGTTVVLHAVWDSGRLELYANGASIASGGTYTASASTPTYLYIGSTSGPANHHNQAFRDFTIYGEALTTAQVLADYTNIAPIVADGQRVTSIPYLWTEDGDGSLDSYDDNTNTNWCVVQGVPGSAPADTEYRLTGGLAYDNAALGMWSTREFISPLRILYQDQGGTADATSSGGNYRRVAIGTTETAMNTSTLLWTSNKLMYRFVEGRKWYAMARTRVAGTGKLRQRLALSTIDNVDGSTKVTAPATYFRQTTVPAIFFPRLSTGTFLYLNMAHYIMCQNTTAAVNSDIDFYCLFPSPLATFASGSTTIIRGTQYATEYDASNYNKTGTIAEPIEPQPDTFNVILFAAYGVPAGLADAGVSTITFTRITITPRFALI